MKGEKERKEEENFDLGDNVFGFGLWLSLSSPSSSPSVVLLVHDVSDLNERTLRENSSGKKRSHCRGLRGGRQHVSNSPSNRNQKPLSYTSYTAKEKEERASALSPTMRTFNSSLVFDGV